MSSLDRFIDSLFRIARPEGMIARYRLGMGLLWRQVRRIRKRLPSEHLPTKGFRKSLWENGQGGEMYRHLHFHLACYLLGPLGRIFSWAVGLLDWKQARSGRSESLTEMVDNAAGRECGIALCRYLQGRTSEEEARARLRGILAAEA